MYMQKTYIINLKEYSDNRGNLISIENNKNIPFDIKRVFYIFGVPNSSIERGNHKNITTKHILIVLNGSCTVECVIENNVKTYILDSPAKGLYIDNGIKKRIYNFKKETILLCLCSELYDINEYEL